jgi:Ca2+-transporting ATPase
MNFEGLKEEKVFESREKFGRNVLPKKSDIFWFSTLIHQLKSPIFYILLLAALISLAFQEYFDFLLIILVVVFNTILGFYQEYRAEKRLLSLRRILKSKALVIREGERRKTEIENLVVGDLVVLGAGDQIPADGVLIESYSFLIQEAILTGESEAIEKKMNEEVFMGTQALSGRGIMKIERIGEQTKIGQIGKDLITIEEEETNLQKKLKKFTKTLALIVGGISIFFFVLSFFQNGDQKEY